MHEDYKQKKAQLSKKCQKGNGGLVMTIDPVQIVEQVKDERVKKAEKTLWHMAAISILEIIIRGGGESIYMQGDVDEQKTQRKVNS
ncbi:hypothetical protein AAF712_016151, partial [Marasmius tenuissimus]